MMIDKFLISCFHSAGWLLVVGFSVSMFMCGDADCLTGNGDENCASLLCSLLNKHDAPSQDAASSAKDCSCVCHAPTITTSTFSFAYHPSSYENAFTLIVSVPSAPNRLVYHPPALA